MTQRERYLAIGVAVVAILFGAQYGFNSITSAISEKQSAVDAAREQEKKLNRKITTGTLATRKLKQLNARSLPSDEELANAQYGFWLTQLGREVGIQGIKVDKPKRARETSAYKAYDFTLHGNCRLEQLFALLGKFYDKNYLHTIESLTAANTKDPDVLHVTLKSKVLALKSAAQEQESPAGSSGRLAMSIHDYRDAILNRNPFSPPNGAPRLRERSLDVIVGQPFNHEMAYSDPEGHPVTVKLVSTEGLPEGLRLRGGALSGSFSEVGKHEVTVELRDNGFPAAVTQETFAINVAEPPKEEPRVEPPKFDAATQAFMAGMVGGRDGAQMWIRSRTEGKTIKMHEGQEFEIGLVKAKVLEINLNEVFALLESNGIRWTLDMDTSLAEAFRRGQED